MVTTSRGTRQTIVDAAAVLFRKQGYSATTMQQVAELTGISKGNLTYHFPSKQALFTEVHDQARAYVRDRVFGRAFEGAPDMLTGVDNFIGRIKRLLVDENGHFVGCLFTNVAVETCHTEPAISALARGTLSEAKAYLATHFERAQSHGEIRDDLAPQVLAQMFFWMYEGALTVSRAWNDLSEFDAFRATVRTLLVTRSAA